MELREAPHVQFVDDGVRPRRARSLGDISSDNRARHDSEGSVAGTVQSIRDLVDGSGIRVSVSSVRV